MSDRKLANVTGTSCGIGRTTLAASDGYDLIVAANEA